ncbi:MAG: YggS family pyridoxal phosphate-dependent enzyme [Candidatus Krumholzibacteriota bacterium]|nr:YggS family pyridoxal phosphate-dependent enzyme [Candidatus Krumholzibacteriota bacterium]
MSIQDNVIAVRRRVSAALDRAGREAGEVTVVAVTKTFGADMVDAVVDAGVGDVGENRLQEFLAKAEGVARSCRWHLVGHLQRNKARRAVGRFHLIHSIDSVRLAESVARIGEEMDEATRILLQVNTSGEGTKSGFAPEELSAVAGRIGTLPYIDLLGLMTIGPVTMDPDSTRRCFQELRALCARARDATGLSLPELSMGMSGDFEMAIEEGATIVRLGRVITGERPV